MVASCITIRGSFVGNRRDMAEALAFAGQGKVEADIELQPRSAINSVFEGGWSMATARNQGRAHKTAQQPWIICA